MKSFESLEKYLSDRYFYNSVELQALVTKVGVDIDDTEQENLDLIEVADELRSGQKTNFEP